MKMETVDRGRVGTYGSSITTDEEPYMDQKPNRLKGAVVRLTVVISRPRRDRPKYKHTWRLECLTEH